MIENGNVLASELRQNIIHFDLRMKHSQNVVIACNNNLYKIDESQGLNNNARRYLIHGFYRLYSVTTQKQLLNDICNVILRFYGNNVAKCDVFPNLQEFRYPLWPIIICKNIFDKNIIYRLRNNSNHQTTLFSVKFMDCFCENVRSVYHSNLSDVCYHFFCGLIGINKKVDNESKKLLFNAIKGSNSKNVYASLVQGKKNPIAYEIVQNIIASRLNILHTIAIISRECDGINANDIEIRGLFFSRKYLNAQRNAWENNYTEKIRCVNEHNDNCEFTTNDINFDNLRLLQMIDICVEREMKPNMDDKENNVKYWLHFKVRRDFGSSNLGSKQSFQGKVDKSDTYRPLIVDKGRILLDCNKFDYYGIFSCDGYLESEKHGFKYQLSFVE